MTITELKTLMSVNMKQSLINSILENVGGEPNITVVSPPIRYKYNHKTDQQKLFIFVCDASYHIPNETKCVYSISRGKGHHLFDMYTNNHSWKECTKISHTLIVVG